MYIDWDKITYNELLEIGEFFDLYIDGDRQTIEIMGVTR